MTRNHSDELRRIFNARIFSMRREVDQLLGNLGDKLSQLAAALEVIREYFDYATAAFDAEWEANRDEITRVSLARGFLLKTVWVENTLDTWLIQSYDAPVPSALVRALEREFELIGQPRQAVLSMSTTDGYVTYVGELAELVLARLSLKVPGPSTDLSGRRFALIQVPRLQVEDPCTWPVVLGHEAAHLALLARPDSVARIDLRNRVDWMAMASSIFDSSRDLTREATNLFRVGLSWTEELLCDAYAVRRYGPAGVAALASFLDMLGTMEEPGDQHPPSDVRVSLMLRWLGDLQDQRLKAVIDPWTKAAASLSRQGKPWAGLISLFTGSLADDIWKAIDDWPVFDLVPDRVLRRADRLLGGAPGLFTAKPTPVPTANDDAEAVNAAWIATVEQENLSSRERLPVERLAAKALDIHEFLRLWDDAHEEVGRSIPLIDPKAIASAETGSVSDRIGVFPSMPDAVSGASIDLRLGSQFIVFQRMSVASIDPVSDRTDPRSFQTIVDKAWGQPFVLHPGELALASTLEYLMMPDDLLGEVGSRSSLGRLGLIPATAVLVHPGFRGCLTLELVNEGTVPILLTPGERIAQLWVYKAELHGVPGSKYDCPTGPEFSKASQDLDIPILSALRRRWMKG